MKETMSFASSANCFSTGSIILPRVKDVHQRSFANINNVPTTIRALRSTSRTRRHQVSSSVLFSLKATLRGNLEAVGVPTSVPVRVAYELLLAGHRYLDVRTPEEFSAGHAPGAVNIPYMYKVGSGMTINPHFLAKVSSHFRKEDEIIVGCQSGKRSMMAATDLLAAGFSCITDIAGGHAAWAQNSLPMEL
ncbi:thiosulfate sulfurtransferase 16, chloroplastic [Morus notabilis]|uniref:thiosulfate sulfurtransferase 16, chloroplastic n=1 Tax=Morus notabilis TaxID=981085 RepID=UPI000CED47C7|nr:thiosulfate sulfurtransferase 16, chloroplastic [Morus notabilis]